MREEGVAAPEVSVLMVAFGAPEWCVRAVAALAANTTASYELIVIDNATGDGTAEAIKDAAPQVRLFTNPSNLGFGAAVDRAALHARGHFICLLNTDALVEPGWLEPLVECLERHPLAGAAVPCLVGLDGEVQEAGARLGEEGSTAALGEGGEPADPSYGFQRAVEYASAACMLMRRSTFLQMGGFDPGFGRGYCEDVDLCLALAEHGLDTLYEPRSKVRHVGGASGASADRLDRLWRANNTKLRRRWADILRPRGPLVAESWATARDATVTERILIPLASLLGRTATSRPLCLATALAACGAGVRVTVAVLEETPAGALLEELLASGVEVAAAAPFEAWSALRRYHYSLVILTDPAVTSRCLSELGRSQPQASVVLDVPGRASEAGYPAEAWEAAEAVLVRRPEDAHLAVGLPCLAVDDGLLERARRAGGLSLSPLGILAAHLGRRILPPGSALRP